MADGFPPKSVSHPSKIRQPSVSRPSAIRQPSVSDPSAVNPSERLIRRDVLTASHPHRLTLEGSLPTAAPLHTKKNGGDHVQMVNIQ